jgi:hypothetical protein
MNRKIGFSLIFLMVLGVHVLRVKQIIPFSLFFSSQRINSTEYKWLLSQLESSANDSVQRQPGSFNPYSMAGYPMLTWAEPGLKVTPAFLRWLTSNLSPPVLAKFLIFMALLSPPIFIYLSCLVFRLDGPTRLCAMALTVASFGFFDLFSIPLIRMGWILFILSSGAGLCALSLYYRILKENKRVFIVPFLFLIFCISIFQPSLFLWLLISFVLMHLTQVKFGGISTWVALLSAGAVVFCTQFPFFEGFLLSRDFIIASPDLSFQFHWMKSVVPEIWTTHEFYRTVKIGILLLTGLAGAVVWIGKDKNKLGAFFLLLLLGTLLLCLVGPMQAGLNLFIPGRFLYVLSLLLVIPAAYLFRILFLRREKLFSSSLFIVFVWFELSWPLRFVDALPPVNFDSNVRSSHPQALNFPKTGRILVEDVDVHLKPILDYPDFNHRETLGRGRHFSMLLHHQATSFFPLGKKTAWFLGKPIQLYQPGEIQEALNRYNIQSVVAYSRVSRLWLNQFPDIFKRVYLLPQFSVYLVSNPSLGYLLKGDGEVRADYGRIEIRDTTSEDLTLKYHWMKALKGPDGVEIYPTYIGNDPVPFIGVRNPQRVKTFVIKSGTL